jgi:DNA-binding NtrC family response regulator
MANETALSRQRVILLENDAALATVLCDLFADEDLDVSVCATLAEIQARIVQYPRAVVVSDSWETSDYQSLSKRHHSEIVELAQLSEVVLTTGSEWARNSRKGELGTAQIVAKPHDLERLMAAIRAALDQASHRMATV